jgi:hypothetical protein
LPNNADATPAISPNNEPRFFRAGVIFEPPV